MSARHTKNEMADPCLEQRWPGRRNRCHLQGGGIHPALTISPLPGQGLVNLYFFKHGSKELPVALAEITRQIGGRRRPILTQLGKTSRRAGSDQCGHNGIHIAGSETAGSGMELAVTMGFG